MWAELSASCMIASAEISTCIAEASMRARSLLFTVYGDSIRPHGGEIGLGSLSRLMAPLGFSARAVRAAMSRMARQGWLQTRRIGRRAYYSLTPRGAWRVEQGVR